MFKFSQYLLITVFIFLSGCLPKQSQNIFIEPHCLASQSQCQVNIALGNFSVLFNVESVNTEQEFKIIVASENVNKNIEIKGYLEGKTMYMGKVPLFFKHHEPQQFSATTMLGSCSEAEMVWRMWLTISDKTKADSSQQLFIDFKSYRR